VNPRRRAVSALLASLALLGAGAAPAPYVQSIEAWRQEREQKLRAEDGWLAVAGLFWLREGANRFGTGADNDAVLPSGSAPARAGTVTLRGGRVTLRLEPGAAAALRGEPVSESELKPDGDDVVTLGRLRLSVIKRSGRYGLRVRDADHARRRGFEGLAWYPVDESYRVRARFVPAAGPRTIEVVNVLGDLLAMPSPGHVEFTLHGRAMRLEPVLEEDSPQLFFIFRDATAGRSTYPAGRYLYADPPRDGAVTLDFNKAYSPPCAFTDFATCPLPPPGNRLAVAVEAGEKNPAHHLRRGEREGRR
jgi:uncharacterized protein (DUF1684 family)